MVGRGGPCGRRRRASIGEVGGEHGRDTPSGKMLKRKVCGSGEFFLPFTGVCRHYERAVGRPLDAP
jgi:hypothetical protein